MPRMSLKKPTSPFSEWVDFIAHEIRTPISGPLSYSRLGLKKLSTGWKSTNLDRVLSELEKKNRADDRIWLTSTTIHGIKSEQEEMIGTLSGFFNRILSAAERLNAMVDELLDLSKLESGKMTFDIKPADLLAIVQEASYEMEAYFQEKGIVMAVEQPEFDLHLECDGFRIGQVIRNLFSNAIKYSPPGKKISITFAPATIKIGRRVGDEDINAVKVTVSDQGEGIPPDQLEHIFEKFNQSCKTAASKGTGLGLAICKEIITNHSGRIWAESDEGGTRFHFLLPYSQHKM